MPLAGGARGILAWGDEAVDPAEMMRGGVEAGTVVDLQFVAATQVHTAIGALGDAELQVQLEVLELLVGRQVRAGLRVVQNARYCGPLVFAASNRVPTIHRRAVEELDRWAPFRSSFSPQRRCAGAFPGEHLAISHRHRTTDAVPVEAPLERDVVGVALPLRRDCEAECPFLEFNLGDRPRAAAGSDELADQGGAP